MTTVRKVKSYKSDSVPPSQMIWRAMEVLHETANAENKSVDVVVASDNPVQRWDERRGGVVSEVLAMDGVQFRGGKTQLPIVDSHDRSTIRNVLGSVRNVRTEGGRLVGTATFARNEDSQEAYQKLIDGHLTDFSITATPMESQFVPRGEIYRVGERQIDGPADIVTRWMPTDASLVAVGADETSTVQNVRRSYMDFDREVQRMLTEEMKAALVAKGMPEQLSDTEQALAWAIGVLGAGKPAEAASEPEAIPEPVEMADDMEEKPAEEPAADPQEEVKKALESDKIRRKEIVALCTTARIERAFADSLCDSGVSLDVARSKVLERLGEDKPVGTSANRIEAIGSADDKFAAAARDGLVMRAMGNNRNSQIERNGGQRYNPFGSEGPAPGAKDFQHLSLLRLAEHILRRGGIETDRLTSRQIALAAMGHEPTLRGMRIQRDAYHTTGVFSDILLDAANKSLLSGYEEAPFTWNIWARQAPSVADFKTIYRTRFSESPDLEEVPENEPYAESIMSDSKESYRVAKFGRIFSTTWETIVNDDLDAISRVPMMHGNAARRVQNKKVYQVLTDNAAMSDGVALFHSSHGNHAGAAAVVSETTLNAMFVSMLTQTGLGGNIINVVPRYIIGPPTASAAIIQTLTSMTPPTVGGSAVGNSGITNMYGPNGSRQLIPVIEPQLEAASTTTWYAAADYNQIDTVELTFLQGEEQPVIESEWDFKKDGFMSKVRQTFGVKAVDWRGLYTNQA